MHLPWLWDWVQRLALPWPHHKAHLHIPWHHLWQIWVPRIIHSKPYQPGTTTPTHTHSTSQESSHSTKHCTGPTESQPCTWTPKWEPCGSTYCTNPQSTTLNYWWTPLLQQEHIPHQLLSTSWPIILTSTTPWPQKSRPYHSQVSTIQALEFIYNKQDVASPYVIEAVLNATAMDTVLNATIQDNYVPKTFNEAMRHSDALLWKDSTDEEIQALLNNGTWEIVKLPPCKGNPH